MPTEFKLPELGENVTSGDVLRVMVAVGDTIQKDQPVVELETDKATIEVPSSVAGVVKEIRVKEGDKVKVGQTILVVDDAKGAEAGDAKDAKEAEPAKDAKPAKDGEAAKETKDAKGAEAADTKDATEAKAAKDPEAAKAKDAKSAPAAAADEGKAEGKAAKAADEKGEKGAEAADAKAANGAKPSGASKSAEAPDVAEVARNVRKAEGSEGPEGAASTEAAAPRSRRGEVVDIRGPRQPAEPSPEDAGPLAPAAPSVRRLARELGVDINSVPGSGPADRISIEDVKDHAKRLISGASAGGAQGPVLPPLPDFTRWGEIERKPMRAVRRKTAEHLSLAWQTIPHVTQHDRADITALEQAREKYAKRVEQAGGSLTITAILLKVIASALKVFPQVNSSIDVQTEELVYKKYVHIGVAVDTERGLLVPVIRDADRKNITQISAELSQLAEKARTNKLTLPEMEGGSFTITNLGGIGGTSFSPIVNMPEVAILGVSRASMQPVWSADRSGFEPRLMLPLSLSYDHRVIDGADAIRFLRWVIEATEQPILLALQG